MKSNTIKWRIFKYNIVAIMVLIAMTAVIFNFAVHLYIEKEIIRQLDMIAMRAENTALQRGPDFFPPDGGKNPPHQPRMQDDAVKEDIDIIKFYFMLDRSLREPLSMLNADYILLDSNKEMVTSPQEGYFLPSDDFLNKVKSSISDGSSIQKYINFSISGMEYIAVIKPVSGKNTFGLGWVIIYSSLQKLNQLKWVINGILFAILLLSAFITAVFSSLAARKISAPFSSLNQHIGEIAERNFGTKINMPVVDELQEFVNNINTMSEKLETYDKAQKTFLQNASHEFRTPLMSIQSYAEGIKYDVVDHDTASDVIIDETRRMTHLVEDLLYLSRLDTIEENYHFENMDLNSFIRGCVERMNGIAAKNDIGIIADLPKEEIMIYSDEEKLSRAVTNIISNCIRYAKSKVEISAEVSNNTARMVISDDGAGFDQNELPFIFDRFYKGKKGNYGLGLAISRNVIEKHNGIISAANSESGAIFIIELPAG